MTRDQILVFVCNFDGLSCLEAFAQGRRTLPARAKLVRVSCLSRVHCGLILDAFRLGAGKVVLMGCESHSCHFGVNEELVNGNLRKARSLMKLLGLDPADLSLVRLPHGDGAGLARTIAQLSPKTEEVGSA